METVLSTGQVGRLLGVQPYRITYAIKTGQIGEASIWFLGKRCFTNEDIERVARHFGMGEAQVVESNCQGSAG